VTGQRCIAVYALVRRRVFIQHEVNLIIAQGVGESVDTVTTLSVTEASRKAGVSRQIIYEQIRRGEIKRSSAGIELTELMRVYPEMTNPSVNNSRSGRLVESTGIAQNTNQSDSAEITIEKTVQQAGTVELLVRELERALIADQARRLDEKDRFWARQVEIAQSLLPAPAPRKKFLGLF